MSEAYKLTPLKETQSIPVNWTFTQEEYDRLIEGHKSNWAVFLRDDVVHFCRLSGQEFYRFKLHKTSDDSYVAHNLEAYATNNFTEKAISFGWENKQIEHKQAEFKANILEEAEGLLGWFGIKL